MFLPVNVELVNILTILELRGGRFCSDPDSTRWSFSCSSVSTSTPISDPVPSDRLVWSAIGSELFPYCFLYFTSPLSHCEWIHSIINQFDFYNLPIGTANAPQTYTIITFSLSITTYICTELNSMYNPLVALLIHSRCI